MRECTAMPLNFNELLDVRLYRAFDLDAAGRVLAGSDDAGTTQLTRYSLTAPALR